MTSMHDALTSPAWQALHEHLLDLPMPEEEESVWLGRIVADLRRLFAARAVVCVLQDAGGRWRRWVDPAPDRGAAVDADVIAGEPAGWIGRVLRAQEDDRPDVRVPAAHGGDAERPASDPDPVWDGDAWGEAAGMIGSRLELPGGRSGAVLLVDAAGATRDSAVRDATARAVADCPVERMLDQVARLLVQAIHNRERVRRLAEEVITDELTGVYNYRYLRQALRREIRRASRFDHPLSVLMLDVDHLKEYNERFGHLRGSQVLRSLAEVLQAGTRDIDILAKYGGDEFLLILPHTDKVGAQVLADRLRRRVADRVFPPLERGAMTCSIGVATYPDDADRSETLMAAADGALFAAKRQGRNRVCAA